MRDGSTETVLVKACIFVYIYSMELRVRQIHLHKCDLCRALFMLTINNVEDTHDRSRRNY